MMSTRKPYPFPRLQNDEDFAGRQMQFNEPQSVPTNCAQGEEPWLRLNRSATLTSLRRTIHHYDLKAPRDSLDFVLKSHYNQHKEFLKPKNETLVQSETLGADHGRQLKNRIINISPGQTDANGVRMSTSGKKESVHSIKKAIAGKLAPEGHHTQSTNAGYSRKPDGGFFTA